MQLSHNAVCVILSMVIVAVMTAQAVAAVGERFPSERKIVRDTVTGRDLTVLTSEQFSSAKIYQTHRQWTADNQWIVFRSGSRGAGYQAYAVNEQHGDIVQLTEGAGNDTSSLCVAKQSMKLYFLRNASAHDRAQAAVPASMPENEVAATQPSKGDATYQIVELDLASLLADSMNNAPKPASAYERVAAAYPEGMWPAGGAALDADERTFYVTAHGGDVGTHLPPGTTVWQKREKDRMGTGPGGLRRVDLATDKWDVIIDTPFQIGHVQSNPWVPGEIVYCHETGGNAPQRMWTVHADGSGNRPLFDQLPIDWVTHETFVTKDEVMFDLIGHQPQLRTRPTGIAVINLRTNAVELLGQIDERKTLNVGDDVNQPQNAAGAESYGGFWHCNGSADGRCAVGDTFAGNLWLINRQDGRRTLLTVDHKMKPDHCHPTFSDDGSRVLIQSGKFTDGKRLQLIVVPVSQP